MRLTSLTETYVCSCCRTVADGCTATQRHWGDGFAYFDEVISLDCEVCGGEIEEGCFCSECGAPTPASEAVTDGDTAYCTDCRRECAFCGGVWEREAMTMSDDGVHEWCPDCARENEEAA